MEAREIYDSIINKTIEQMGKAPEAQGVRKEVFDAIKRRWSSSLDKSVNCKDSGQKSNTSDPNAVLNRAVYLTHPALVKKEESVSVANAASSTEPRPRVVDEDEEYLDEFGDSEVVHTTEVGRRLAAASVVQQSSAVRSPEPVRKPLPSRKVPPVDPIELAADLEDPEYDQIPEPRDCECRIFGQTEICESVVGPRRSDSRWMLTILNGFVQMSPGGELFFRTAKATLPHLLQHRQN